MTTADEIRQEIAASRAAVRQDFHALRDELDFAAKAKRTVARNPVPWLGGAAIFGYLLSGRKKAKPARAKGRGGDPVEEPAKKLTALGVLLAAARLLLPLARPALTDFATRKLADFAGRRFPR